MKNKKKNWTNTINASLINNIYNNKLTKFQYLCGRKPQELIKKLVSS